MRYDQKMGYILDLCRELQAQELKIVRNVWLFAMHYMPDRGADTQQNPDFVEPGAASRIQSKSVRNPPLPDLITDVLDRPKRL